MVGVKGLSFHTNGRRDGQQLLRSYGKPASPRVGVVSDTASTALSGKRGTYVHDPSKDHPRPVDPRRHGPTWQRSSPRKNSEVGVPAQALEQTQGGDTGLRGEGKEHHSEV